MHTRNVMLGCLNNVLEVAYEAHKIDPFRSVPNRSCYFVECHLQCDGKGNCKSARLVVGGKRLQQQSHVVRVLCLVVGTLHDVLPRHKEDKGRECLENLV